MKNLRTYFTVVFDTPRISDDKLRKFVEVHLKRLAANNPGGIFSSLLAATTTAYDDYFGAITDEDTKAAIQKGLTKTMNDTLEEFIRAVRRREGTIKGEFDKDSAAYLEFFPQGLTEYNQSTLANVETLMARFVNASTKHVAELGQPFVDRFVGLKQAFVAARAAQLTAMGEVKGEKLGTAEARTALEDQLMDNVLTLAMKFKRDADTGMSYFDQSIIRPAGEGDDEEPATPTPTPATPV
jgi:hypothetical protein